jgi:hypothetical protein
LFLSSVFPLIIDAFRNTAQRIETLVKSPPVPNASPIDLDGLRDPTVSDKLVKFPGAHPDVFGRRFAT